MAQAASSSGTAGGTRSIPDYRMGTDRAFEVAVAETLLHEGGYVDDPDDPGGETKFGIAKRYHPDVDVESLTPAQARWIYYHEYWKPHGYAHLPAPVGAKLFDIGTNMNRADVHRALQRALRAGGHPVVEDGIIGPVTHGAVDDVAAQIGLAGLMAALRSEIAAEYRVRVARAPYKAKWINGWLSRAYS
jgi:lysozyme family protein